MLQFSRADGVVPPSEQASGRRGSPERASERTEEPAAEWFSRASGTVPAPRNSESPMETIVVSVSFLPFLLTMVVFYMFYYSFDRATQLQVR